MTSFSYALSFSLSFLSLRHIVILATMDELLVRLELLGKESRWREGRGHHARVHDSPKVTRPLIRQRSLVSVVVSEVGPPQDQFAAEHAHRGEPTITQRGELGVGA